MQRMLPVTAVTESGSVGRNAMHLLQFLIFVMSFTTTSGEDERAAYRQLPDAVAKQMERQRAFISNLVAEKFPGERITGTEKDFALVQRILDGNLLQKTQTWELQSLGIVFGDALIKRIPGLHWMEVTDSYGTDPALLYLDTTLQLSAPTMLLKRVEDETPIDVADLVLALVEHVEKEAHEVAKRPKRHPR